MVQIRIGALKNQTGVFCVLGASPYLRGKHGAGRGVSTHMGLRGFAVALALAGVGCKAGRPTDGDLRRERREGRGAGGVLGGVARREARWGRGGAVWTAEVEDGQET